MCINQNSLHFRRREEHNLSTCEMRFHPYSSVSFIKVGKHTHTTKNMYATLLPQGLPCWSPISPWNTMLNPITMRYLTQSKQNIKPLPLLGGTRQWSVWRERGKKKNFFTQWKQIIAKKERLFPTINTTTAQFQLCIQIGLTRANPLSSHCGFICILPFYIPFFPFLFFYYWEILQIYLAEIHGFTLLCVHFLPTKKMNIYWKVILSITFFQYILKMKQKLWSQDKPTLILLLKAWLSSPFKPWLRFLW